MPAPNYWVVTAVGPDQLGLIRRLSTVVRELGVNQEDSRMAILGGEFAIILLLSGRSDVEPRLREQLATLEAEMSLRVFVKATTRPSQPSEHLGYQLKVTGVDHPGIVERITSVLAEKQVNIASLESHLSYAPLSGTPMFVLEAALQVPKGMVLNQLRRELTLACEEENLDMWLEAWPGFN